MTTRVETTTILFTDLVNSTELMQRAGDEDAQRMFKSHYELLRDAVAANGGAEVKSLGDGLLVTFNAAADAVRCAMMMQQASLRRIAGERLAIRVGINSGDTFRDEGDLFGTPVVVARRLCDRAETGQILCSAVVQSLLAGRQAFSFKDIGDLDLKGISAPVAAREVTYERESAGVPSRTAFVGRRDEGVRLRVKLDDSRAGHGGLVMVAGEPGMGKTRLLEEFAVEARQSGVHVLWGRCYEGDWAPPFGPFAEAIAIATRDDDAASLRECLGLGAAPIARLVPAIHERISDIGDPAPLQPDEERFRLLDAVAQFLIALSRRAPLLLVLDDLHWADRGTISMLRHIARFAPNEQLLIIGLYRDVELDRQHPLADALAALRREAEYERISLKGLNAADVGTLISSMAEQDVNHALIDTISRETDGNPFFIREVLAHLVEEGKLYHEDDEWRSRASTIAELGIPEGVRQVIGRRVSRLSDDANKLLSTASAFNGSFRLETAAISAGLDERAALDAVDEALVAQLVRPGGDAEHYDFTHALIRHTLYGELNPTRQVRLHRTIAEAIEAYATSVASEQAAKLAGSVAYHYHRSAAMTGAERGIEHALDASGHSVRAYAWDEAAAFIEMALDMMPQGDDRRPSAARRLATLLLGTDRHTECVEAACLAARLTHDADGDLAAADYLGSIVGAAWMGATEGAWRIADEGMKYAVRGDENWCRFRSMQVFRDEALDPEFPGVAVESSARSELRRFIDALPPRSEGIFEPYYTSRQQILDDEHASVGVLSFMAGEFTTARQRWHDELARAENTGLLANQLFAWANIARMNNALGDLDAADEAMARGRALARRVTPLSAAVSNLGGGSYEIGITRDIGWERAPYVVEPWLRNEHPERRWAFASTMALGAVIYAKAGDPAQALRWLARVMPAIERSALWAANYTGIIGDAALVLWDLQRTDYADVLERNLLMKVIEPDFRYMMRDGRLCLARLCTLQRRYDEATDWFAKARIVLDEQGARPLRAIVDFDEALMYVRRKGEGDAERALNLVDVAIGQFRDVRMTGWISRAESLRNALVA